MKLGHDERHDDTSRAMKRRFRILAGGLLALTLVLNVAPVAANHLNVKTSDINNGAVTNPKLGNGAVGTAKLKNEAVGTAKLKGGAVKSGKIANGVVGRKKLGQQAVTARAYANVLPAPPVPPGTPIAAPVDGSRSKNMGVVLTHGGPVLGSWTGNYCVLGLPFEPHAAVVTPGSSAQRASVSHGASGACPANTQLTVRITNSSNNAANGPFQIVIF